MAPLGSSTIQTAAKFNIAKFAFRRIPNPRLQGTLQEASPLGEGIVSIGALASRFIRNVCANHGGRALLRSDYTRLGDGGERSPQEPGAPQRPERGRCLPAEYVCESLGHANHFASDHAILRPDSRGAKPQPRFLFWTMGENTPQLRSFTRERAWTRWSRKCTECRVTGRWTRAVALPHVCREGRFPMSQRRFSVQV